MIGKSGGDSAEVHTPGGVKSYGVLSIALFDMSKVAEQGQGPYSKGRVLPIHLMLSQDIYDGLG